MVIQALKESYGGRDYTSARMNTAGKFSITYGKFEVRAKIPGGQGIWPAFWLLGENIGEVGWPACGEIDIMEYVGRDPTHTFGSIHATNFDTSDGYYNPNGFTNDFHLYSVNWQPDRIEFYVDNNLFRTVYKSQSGGHWPFEGKNFFIILNLAVGGNWPGYPDGSTHFPAQFLVDYVRVYEMSWGEPQTMAVESSEAGFMQ